MTDLHPFLAQIEANRLICLDAEFADGRYMLELSISNASGQLIYNRRFKPARIAEWGTIPHGITPAMVADAPHFSRCISEIQTIIDTADYITGFALENDFRHLRAEGIHIPDEKKVIEVKDWFWILHGQKHGFDYQKGVSNQNVAAELGIEADESRLHASDYDIELSLSSLNRLLHSADTSAFVSLDAMYPAVMEHFKVEKEKYDRQQSAGFCYIVRKENGYWVKFNQNRPRPSSSIIALIEVESRKEAKLYMSQLFLNRIEDGSFFVEKISNAKLEKFKAYSNRFSAEDSAVQSKLLRLAGKFAKH